MSVKEMFRQPSTICSELSPALSPWPSPRLPDDDRGAHSFNRREEQVRRKSGRPGTDKGRNEGQAAVYKGHNCTRDDIRQPVGSKRK